MILVWVSSAESAKRLKEDVAALANRILLVKADIKLLEKDADKEPVSETCSTLS